MDKRLPIAVATLALDLALASCADVRMAGTDDDAYYEFGLYDSNETLPAAMADAAEMTLVQAP
jgi:hypothetical protein